ncbi:MAG: FCD domain-containing protein [Pseudomonadota bacterium]
MVGMAARLCAERPGPDDLVALRRLAEDLDYTILSSEVRVFLRHNAAFHGKIIACARNPELAELVSRLSIPLMRFQFLAFVDRGFIRRSQEDHLAIT